MEAPPLQMPPTWTSRPPPRRQSGGAPRPAQLSRNGSRQRVLGALTRKLSGHSQEALEDIAEGAASAAPRRYPQLSALPPPRVPPPRYQLSIDGTMSDARSPTSRVECHEDAVRFPATVRRDAGALALLAWELRTLSAHRQQLSLTLFLRACGRPEAERLGVSDADAAELLSILFILMQRRSGFTTWQLTLHQNVSVLAFRTLERLFRAGRWFAVMRRSLLRLLENVNCTDEEYYKRAELPSPAHQHRSGADADSFSSGSDDDGGADDIGPAQAALAAAEAAATSVLVPRRRAPTSVLPFLRTLYCVDPMLLGDLNEARFTRIAEDFATLDSDGSGSVDLQELLSEGSAMINGKNIASRSFFQEVDEGGDGSLCLMELLEFWFPHVPKRFLDRRVAIFQKEERARRAMSPGSNPPALASPAAADTEDCSQRSAASQQRLDATPSCRTAASVYPHVGFTDEEVVCDDWMEGLRIAARCRLQKEPGTNLTALLGQAGIKTSPTSLTVTEVEGDSAGESRGVRVGWIVSEVDMTPVTSVADAEEALRFAEDGTCTVILRVEDIDAAVCDFAGQDEEGDVPLSPTNGGPMGRSVSSFGEQPAESSPNDLKKMMMLGQALARMRQSRPPWSAEVAMQIKSEFDALDIDASGEITFAEIQLNGGQIAGVQITHDLFKKIDRDHSGEISLVEVCKLLYPGIVGYQINVTVRKVIEQEKEMKTQRLALKAEDAETYKKEELLRRVRPGERTRRLQAAVADARMRLVEETERAKANQIARGERRKARRAEWAKRRNEAKENQNLGPCCPVVLGCMQKPPTSSVAGVRLDSDCFTLESFLTDPQTRAAAVRLLTTLDAAGINVRFLCPSPCAYLPTLLCDRRRVYRSSFSSPHCPPLAGQQGPTHLYFYTNLRRRCDLMFRAHFEGSNWGMRTVQVPFADAQPGVRVRMRPVGSDPECTRGGLVVCRRQDAVVVKWGFRHGMAVIPKQWWESDGRPVTETRTPVVSTIVVGSCGRRLEKLGKGAMEGCGWPTGQKKVPDHQQGGIVREWDWDAVPGRDGWDAEMVRHLSSGLSEALAYYSYDDTATIRLSAPCVIALGISASVWLTGTDDAAFPFVGTFSYTDKDLVTVGFAAAVAVLRAAAEEVAESPASPPPSPATTGLDEP